MKCPNCGFELEDGAMFCPSCGARVRLGSSPSEAPKPEPAQAPAPREESGFIPKQESLPAESSAGYQQVPTAQSPTSQPAVQPAAPQPKKGMSPILRILLAVAGIALVVFGIMQIVGGMGGGGDTPPDEPNPPEQQVEVDPESWTVFVYICGSNLETQAGLATENIVELLSVDLPDNVTFVLETGGADRWRNDVMDASYLEYYEVVDHDVERQMQLDRQSMGNPQVLADFLTWGVANYPAAHYGLIFWDHGGGTLGGVCQDELDYDTLELPEIQEGIAAADVTFEFVGFDTCLMATLETAQMLAPYANYMVASEEVEPGGGWAWDAWPEWFQTREGGTVGLGRAICDTYMDKCKHDRVSSTATLSVVDLSRVDELAAAFAEASAAMAKASESPTRFQGLVQRALQVRSFGHASYLEGYTDMVDLGDLMDLLDDQLGRTDDKVSDELYNAVVYERHGMYMSGCTGLSVFYPLNIDEETFSAYYELSSEYGLDNPAYLQYLAVRTGNYDDFHWSEGVPNLDPVKAADARGKIKAEATINDDGRFVVEITGGGEWVATTTYRLGIILEDGSVVDLGTDNDMTVGAVRDSGNVTYTDNFNGMWFKVGDAYVYAEIVEMVQENGRPSYNLYSTPCEWTTTDNTGQEVTYEVNLLISYDYDTDSYEVVCVYQNVDESGMSGKPTASLSTGDTLRFLVSHEVDGQTETGSTGTITWTSDTEVTMAYLGDAQFVYIATVRDIFGEEHMVGAAVFTYENAERTEAKLANVE